MHLFLQIQTVPIKQMYNIFPIHHASETNTACLTSNKKYILQRQKHSMIFGTVFWLCFQAQDFLTNILNNSPSTTAGGAMSPFKREQVEP